ncbi:DUF4127 family protein [Thermoanaerobacterium sp. RBIITD]|uniref:DUF4127 family protein n=1 Tax=Thermoanaerobacterium sp. RBIITD TaxID=1550240 RepID=UPI000BB7D4B5|nr:DUF4127 family protein [Thermoanaerobacterium sp. RBIITD]SNX54592.1 Protein of unknown function [Thermoanaerobacterium sp. RBIITD]
MCNKVMYIPLDERPCNYIYPKMIMDISDIEMIEPPLDILGNKKIPADIDKLSGWIINNINNVSYLILSIDMLLYGGIVPSRLHKKTTEDCIKRLETLKKLKSINKNLKIIGFNLIMRAPSYNSSDEEPDYYENYGEKIFQYGVISDKLELNIASDDDISNLNKIKNEIPEDALEDLLNRRQVNHIINLKVVDFVKEGIIDFLVIPMDDCSKYGFSARERRKVMKYVDDLDLTDRIYSYPGADEVGCVLTARVFNNIKGIKPTVFIRYSSDIGSTLIPKYEDRSLNETVKYQVISSGGIIVNDSSEADFILMINPPSDITLKLADNWQSILSKEDVNDPERNLNEFVETIDYYIKKGKLCAVADVAMPNGADNRLMMLIKKYKLLNKLLSYGGWNTSSNTLGTVISHSMISSCYLNKNIYTQEQMIASEKFLFLRYLEDWGYQHFVRSSVTDLLSIYGLNYFSLKDKGNLISDIIKKKLYEFRDRYLNDFHYDFDVYMPWNRMFEVGIKIGG